MPLSFPSNPNIGDISTQNGREYEWTGAAWHLVSTIVGHTHTSDDITDFDNAVNELMPNFNSIMNGRLSLSSTESITTTDTNSSTIYYHPYDGNMVFLYDTISSSWKDYTLSSVLSYSISSLSSNTNYDVFLSYNGSSLELSVAVWSNSEAGTGARSISLTKQNGILVKSDDLSKRYIGSFRTQTQTPLVGSFVYDTATRRLLYNYYNGVSRRLADSNNYSHTYNSNTIRSWNNGMKLVTILGSPTLISSPTRIQFIIGWDTHSNINVNLNASLKGSSDGDNAIVYVGLNSASSGTCGCLQIENANNQNIKSGSSSLINVPIGYNYLECLESVTSGTATFDNIFIISNILS